MSHNLATNRITRCGIALAVGFGLFAGCVAYHAPPSQNVFVWGRRGLDHGRFQKPRALAIDGRDQLYIADKTGLIQKFNRDGEFIQSWRLPQWQTGLPCGLSISNDGKLMVADTHYFRILFYEPDGRLIPERTIGGSRGQAAGEFGFVTDVVQDAAGNYFVSEYGDFDRIQKFDVNGQFVMQWGTHGTNPGEFLRPQSLAFDREGLLWVADACNHRIQVFDVSSNPPQLVKVLGGEGSESGKLRYPYSIVFDPDGNLYICELGNHRIQHWRPDGRCISAWGAAGREPGQLNQPWAIVLDSSGFIHVLDTHNHRVQRVKF